MFHNNFRNRHGYRIHLKWNASTLSTENYSKHFWMTLLTTLKTSLWSCKTFQTIYIFFSLNFIELMWKWFTLTFGNRFTKRNNSARAGYFKFKKAFAANEIRKIRIKFSIFWVKSSNKWWELVQFKMQLTFALSSLCFSVNHILWHAVSTWSLTFQLRQTTIPISDRYQLSSVFHSVHTTNTHIYLSVSNNDWIQDVGQSLCNAWPATNT